MENINIQTLNKKQWLASEFKDYYNFIDSLKASQDKCNWEQTIVKTKLPCLALGSEKTKLIANQIYKGNYVDFLKNIKFKTHTDTIIFALLLNKIKDFDLFKSLLISFSTKVDNWASCDTLKHKNKDKQKLLELCYLLLKNKYNFARRIAVNILFEFINKEDIKTIFKVLDFLQQENDYYVNMSAAWLLCECFIKLREESLSYYKSNKTNRFIINKSISKCHDSFRVNAEDKLLLKTFKK